MFIKNLEITNFIKKIRNQPARSYATAKVHKFQNLADICLDKLKFRPIIDQIGTFIYDAAKVIGEYLKPLPKNEDKLNDCQEFQDMFKDLPPVKDNEEYDFCDVDSLFRNIPLNYTTDYVIHKIYDEKVLQLIY